MRVTLRYGAVESLSGLNAACEALPALMLRGTRSLSRQQIQDLLDKNRARITPSGSVGEASFMVEATRSTLPAVLDLLRQISPRTHTPRGGTGNHSHPARERYDAAAHRSAGPRAGRRPESAQPLSPTDVRYAPSVPESIDRWKALGRDDVVRVYEQFLGGEHGELALVGDFDVAATQVALSGIFDGWSAKEPYHRIPRPGDLAIAGRKEKIETPDKDNAVYFAGEVIPMKDSDPDYPALTIGNFVLGSSGLSSRLGDRVRQKEGLSYGVGSGLRANSLDARAVFSAYAITNPANMGKVETAISEEISRIISGASPRKNWSLPSRATSKTRK